MTVRLVTPGASDHLPTSDLSDRSEEVSATDPHRTMARFTRSRCLRRHTRIVADPACSLTRLGLGNIEVIILI